ncbi:hypothetical protein ACMBCM_07380 [Spiroplasma sp. K1]
MFVLSISHAYTMNDQYLKYIYIYIYIYILIGCVLVYYYTSLLQEKLSYVKDRSI